MEDRFYTEAFIDYLQGIVKKYTKVNMCLYIEADFFPNLTDDKNEFENELFTKVRFCDSEKGLDIKDVHKFIDGCAEIVNLSEDLIMIVNESSALSDNKKANFIGTMLYNGINPEDILYDNEKGIAIFTDCIFGNIIIVNRKNFL